MADEAGDLLDAAGELLANGGLAELSVRRVAAAAGCSTMAIYSRFGGKSGLFEALARQGFERLAEAQLEARDRSGGDRAGQLFAMCAAHRAVALADPVRYRLMFDDPGDGARAAARRSIALLADAAGAEAAELLFAVCHGIVSAELAGVISPVERRLRAAVERCAV